MKFALRSWYYIIAGLAQGVEFTLKVNRVFVQQALLFNSWTKWTLQGALTAILGKRCSCSFGQFPQTWKKAAFLNQWWEMASNRQMVEVNLFCSQHGADCGQVPPSSPHGVALCKKISAEMISAGPKDIKLLLPPLTHSKIWCKANSLRLDHQQRRTFMFLVEFSCASPSITQRISKTYRQVLFLFCRLNYCRSGK